MERSEITWRLTAKAQRDLSSLRRQLGEEDYFDLRDALQDLLCGYFDSDADCREKLGSSISPMGGVEGGGKAFKVRGVVPGAGKSGGLRLAVAVFCDKRMVKVVRGWFRVDDPSDADFLKAFDEASKT